MGARPSVPSAPVLELPAGADALPDRRPFPIAGSSSKEIMFELIRSAFTNEETSADRLRVPAGREGGKALRAAPSAERD